MGGLLKLRDKLQALFRGSKPNKGFTLIEVVIVLAIAGLIFVVVFLAVGAAQRGRRDSERQQAASRLLAAVDQASSNLNGAMPANCAAVANYYNNQGGSYPCTAMGGAGDPTAANSGNIQYGPNQSCTAANAFQATTRVAAVRFWSEGAGAARCVDND